MKRSILGIGIAAVLLLAFAVPATAAANDNAVISVNLQSDQPAQHWRITMAATVVANTGDNLVVYLANPRNLATDESDLVNQLQVLPIVPATAATDSAGKAVALDAVLPGQAVRVTFRYHWLDSSPRMPQMDRCIAVELVGETKTASSSAAVDDFARDQQVGTVLSVSGREMEVYLETGRVYHGGTEYLARGRQRLTVDAGASVVGPDGRGIQLSAIKPFERVVLTASDYMWAESMPPQLALQAVNRVQLLADGEKVIAPVALAQCNQVTATVTAVNRTENGTVYTVRPAEGSREREISETFTVAAPMFAEFDEAQKSVLDEVRTGTVVVVRYEGLVYGEGVESRIDWAHSIRLAPGE